MVTDRLAWSEATAQWIREAMTVGVSMFGVCYGHQLMAHALGDVSTTIREDERSDASGYVSHPKPRMTRYSPAARRRSKPT